MPRHGVRDAEKQARAVAKPTMPILQGCVGRKAERGPYKCL